MTAKRPPVRVRFKYNIDTGAIEDFIIDDNAITASEDYHKAVAKDIASLIGRKPRISDAGGVRLSGAVRSPAAMPETTDEEEKGSEQIED